jgi:hypothetical protein
MVVIYSTIDTVIARSEATKQSLLNCELPIASLTLA